MRIVFILSLSLILLGCNQPNYIKDQSNSTRVESYNIKCYQNSITGEVIFLDKLPSEKFPYTEIQCQDTVYKDFFENNLK